MVDGLYCINDDLVKSKNFKEAVLTYHYIAESNRLDLYETFIQIESEKESSLIQHILRFKYFCGWGWNTDITFNIDRPYLAIRKTYQGKWCLQWLNNRDYEYSKKDLPTITSSELLKLL